MSSNRDDQVTIRQYLLGQLTGEERMQFEQRLFTDDGLLELLHADEDELLDESLAGELSKNEARLFENHFLISAERQQKLRFARALKRYTSEHQPISGPWSTRSWTFWATAAVAALVLISGIAWLLRPLEEAPRKFVALTLTVSSGTRAEGPQANKVKLPPDAEALRLTLKLPESPPQQVKYRIELLKESGETRNFEGVSQDGQSVEVEIPASQLSRGQYALNVYMIRPDGTEQRLRGSYLLTVE